MYDGFSNSPIRGITVFALAVVSFVAACSLPEPDGTEAALAAEAEGLPVLAVMEGRSPQAVVSNGLLLDPSVRAAASDVAASADEVRVQRAVLFPSLGLSLDAGLSQAGQETNALALNGRQLILDFGTTKRAVTAADIDVQINYLTFQESVDTAIFDVLETYDSVLRYVRLMGVRKKQLAVMTDLQALVTRQTDIGAAPASDVLEARKRVQTARFLVHEAELQVDEARARLTRLTGQGRGGDVSGLGSSQCSQAESADEIRIARLELAKAELDLEQAEAARVPRAYVNPIIRQPLNGGVTLGANISVDSDLLQGGALTAQANAARNSRDGANAGIDTARRNILFDVIQNRREIAAAQSRRALLNNQLSLLAETQELYRSQYLDLGTREVSDLLDNEEEIYDRQAELVELESDLAMNRIACAIRDGDLRKSLGVERRQIYGYPLSEPVLIDESEVVE